MINMADIVNDFTMTAPEPFTIQRSTGVWAIGTGFESYTIALQALGPVQRASDKELRMLPEADVAGGLMHFWWTQPIYITRNPATGPQASDILQYNGDSYRVLGVKHYPGSGFWRATATRLSVI